MLNDMRPEWYRDWMPERVLDLPADLQRQISRVNAKLESDFSDPAILKLPTGSRIAITTSVLSMPVLSTTPNVGHAHKNIIRVLVHKIREAVSRPRSPLSGLDDSR
jgi:hypothetical protein